MARRSLPASSETLHFNDAKLTRIRKRVLESARYVCQICGHGPNDSPSSPADGIDHVIPLSECAVRIPPISPYNPNNLMAAHSVKPCRVCLEASAKLGNTEPGKRAGWCNSLRGSQSLAYARAKIADRTGLRIVDVEPGSNGRYSPVEVGERDWL